MYFHITIIVIITIIASKSKCYCTIQVRMQCSILQQFTYMQSGNFMMEQCKWHDFFVVTGKRKQLLRLNIPSSQQFPLHQCQSSAYCMFTTISWYTTQAKVDFPETLITWCELMRLFVFNSANYAISSWHRMVKGK